MATPDSVEFNSDAVVAFITENGGKATTAEVAIHFRKYLVDEENQEKNKALFREYVNAVAVIKRVENEKVLVLKAGVEKKEPNRNSDSVQSTALRSLGSSIESIPTDDSRSLQEVISKENRLPSGSSTESADHSSDSSVRSKDCIETLKEMEYAETNDHHIATPVAPPRRKHSMKEKKSVTQSEEVDSGKVANAGGDKESEPKISVKEQAQKINKFVSESQLVLRPHNANLKKPSREIAFDKNADDDDRASVISVNPSTKEWMVVAAKADYHAMIKLLRDEPKLAKYKDFISGYTALHWAAKHGNAEVVKLIAGTHGANVNIRSHGGYTPLHLAAMFQRKAVYELLASTYHADQSIQDYNGRTAKEYLQHKHVSSSSSSGSKSESSKPTSPGLSPSSILACQSPTQHHLFTFMGVSVVANSHHLSKRAKRKSSAGGDLPIQRRSYRKSSRGYPERKSSAHESFLRLHRPKINRRRKTTAIDTTVGRSSVSGTVSDKDNGESSSSATSKNHGQSEP